MQGIQKDYLYLSKIYGNKNEDWVLEMQSLSDHLNRLYDVMEIKLKSGEVLKIHFDITEFFGKH